MVFKAMSAWWDNFTRRFRLSLNNTRDNREIWYTHISPVNLLMVFVATFVVMFVLILSIISYTSVLEALPGYRSEALRSRQMVIDNILRLDSMERVIDDIMLYNENVALIMSGKAPISQDDYLRDSVAHAKALVAPNLFDSTLRRDIEQGRYDVRINNAVLMTPMVLPADGVVTRQFDISNEYYGVDIAVASGERIMATQQGMVMLSMWTPDNGYVVQILHPNNIISIYQNISDLAVSRGEYVDAGAVIGYNGEKGVDMDNREIHFEIWDGSKPLDPEKYIVF